MSPKIEKMIDTLLAEGDGQPGFDLPAEASAEAPRPFTEEEKAEMERRSLAAYNEAKKMADQIRAEEKAKGGKPEVELEDPDEGEGGAEEGDDLGSLDDEDSRPGDGE